MIQYEGMKAEESKSEGFGQLPVGAYVGVCLDARVESETGVPGSLGKLLTHKPDLLESVIPQILHDTPMFSLRNLAKFTHITKNKHLVIGFDHAEVL